MDEKEKKYIQQAIIDLHQALSKLRHANEDYIFTEQYRYILQSLNWLKKDIQNG